MKLNILTGLICLLFLSCSTFKIKEFDSDTTQPLVGKVKKQVIITETYQFEKSVKPSKDTITLYYDENNRIVKQIDHSKSLSTTNVADFFYNEKGLLEKQLLRSADTTVKRIITTNYEYDKKGNLIHYKQSSDDEIISEKVRVYDTHGNMLIENFIKRNVQDRYKIDYKKREVTVQSYKNNVPTKQHLVRLYDNKGYLLKSEYIHIDPSNSFCTEYTYDKKGNLVKEFDCNNKIVRYLYINEYDDKGNIKQRDLIFEGSLAQSTKILTTYW